MSFNRSTTFRKTDFMAAGCPHHHAWLRLKRAALTPVLAHTSLYASANRLPFVVVAVGAQLGDAFHKLDFRKDQDKAVFGQDP